MSTAINGGGIYLYGVDALITSCIIDNCHASNAGGGIVAINGASPMLTHCIISDCTATTSGGGLYASSGPSTITMINCAIHENRCTTDAGGGLFFNSGSDGILTNCTIGDNNSDGNAGGLYAYQCTLDLTDCIIWGNAAGAASFGNQLMAAGSPAQTYVTFDYCCLPSNAQDSKRFGGGGTITELGTCVNADPLFWIGPLGNFYLSQTAAGQGSDTPCLDAGSDTAANLGLDARTTRSDQVPDAGTVDIGFHYDAP
jgi:hypothetical protein